MKIRAFCEADAKETLQLFCDTVRSVCLRDYTKAQTEAWVGAPREAKAWAASFEGRIALVAEEDGVIAGFADMTREGYLDRLYVHKDLQGRGIASRLCDALEQACGAQVYTVFSSVTARGFFEKRGYAVVRRNEVKRGNETLVNFLMSKKR